MLSAILQGFDFTVNRNTGKTINLNPLKIGVEKLQLSSSKGALGKPTLKTNSKGSKNNILLWFFLSISPLSAILMSGNSQEISTKPEKSQFWTDFELPKEKDNPTYLNKPLSLWRNFRNSTTREFRHNLLLVLPSYNFRWWWLQLSDSAQGTSSSLLDWLPPKPKNWLLLEKMAFHPEGIRPATSCVGTTHCCYDSIIIPRGVINRTISKNGIALSDKFKCWLFALGILTFLDQSTCGLGHPGRQPGFGLLLSYNKVAHHLFYSNRNPSSFEIHRDSRNLARFSAAPGFMNFKFYNPIISSNYQFIQPNQIVCGDCSLKVGIPNRLKALQTLRPPKNLKLTKGCSWKFLSFKYVSNYFYKYFTIRRIESIILKQFYGCFSFENGNLPIKQGSDNYFSYLIYQSNTHLSEITFLGASKYQQIKSNISLLAIFHISNWITSLNNNKFDIVSKFNILNIGESLANFFS
jgi:hypothetical protein